MLQYLKSLKERIYPALEPGIPLPPHVAGLKLNRDLLALHMDGAIYPNRAVDKRPLTQKTPM